MVVGRRIELLKHKVHQGHVTRMMLAASEDMQKLKVKCTISSSPDAVSGFVKRKMARVLELLEIFIEESVVNDHGHTYSSGQSRVELYFGIVGEATKLRHVVATCEHDKKTTTAVQEEEEEEHENEPAHAGASPAVQPTEDDAANTTEAAAPPEEAHSKHDEEKEDTGKHEMLQLTAAAAGAALAAVAAEQPMGALEASDSPAQNNTMQAENDSDEDSSSSGYLDLEAARQAVDGYAEQILTLEAALTTARGKHDQAVATMMYFEELEAVDPPATEPGSNG